MPAGYRRNMPPRHRSHLRDSDRARARTRLCNPQLVARFHQVDGTNTKTRRREGFCCLDNLFARIATSAAKHRAPHNKNTLRLKRSLRFVRGSTGQHEGQRIKGHCGAPDARTNAHALCVGPNRRQYGHNECCKRTPAGAATCQCGHDGDVGSHREREEQRQRKHDEKVSHGSWMWAWGLGLRLAAYRSCLEPVSDIWALALAGS